MKNNIIGSSIISSFLFLHANCYSDFSQSYYQSIDNISILETADAQDIVYALNWLYSGYKRSLGTIYTQTYVLEMLNASWQSWQIVTHRRRNPSKTAPHARAYQALTDLSQKTQSALEEYQNLLDTYDTISSRIFSSSCITNKTIQLFLENVKTECRAHITASLVDVRSLFDELSSLNWIFKGVSRIDMTPDIDLDEPDEILQDINRSLLNSIKDKLPGLAFNSFVNADIGYIKASDSHWALLYNAQLASVAIWKKVETSRAHVLKNAYEHMYRHAQDSGITPIALTFGVLSEEIELLPEPCMLESYNDSNEQ